MLPTQMLYILVERYSTAPNEVTNQVTDDKGGRQFPYE